MFSKERKHEAREQILEYATRKDFEAIFSDDMSALHMLALLLTADPARAEQCFVAGLEESIEGNPVFRQWARSWSKRVIIRNAIKMMSPAPGQSNAWRASVQPAASEKDALMSVVWELPPFERFVFVISVLEGHSASDCASLLGCTLTELTQARSEALKQIGSLRVPQIRKPLPLRFAATLGLA